MNSKNQQKVIAFLQEHKTATGRQLATVLGRSNKSTWNILMHLLRREIITHDATGDRKVLQLTLGWESKVYHRKTVKRCKPVAPAITDICRQNWQGYKVHQVFGSAKS